MKLKDNVAKALNDQFNKERHSATIYQAMAADFSAKNLAGFASWMEAQAQEELFHAEKIKGYLEQQGSRVYFQAAEAPVNEFDSIEAVFKAALAHEEFITASILDLVKLARKEDDTPTELFLQWYVTEQVEEEATAQEVLDKLSMIGDSPVGLYNLDRDMGMRNNAPIKEE